MNYGLSLSSHGEPDLFARASLADGEPCDPGLASGTQWQLCGGGGWQGSSGKRPLPPLPHGFWRLAGEGRGRAEPLNRGQENWSNIGPEPWHPGAPKQPWEALHVLGGTVEPCCLRRF